MAAEVSSVSRVLRHRGKEKAPSGDQEAESSGRRWPLSACRSQPPGHQAFPTRSASATPLARLPLPFPSSLLPCSFTVSKRNYDQVDLKIKMNGVTHFIRKNIFALSIYIIFLINDMFKLSFILLFLANVSRHNKHNFKTVLLIIHWVSAKFQWCRNDRNMLPFHYPYPKISY